MSTPKGIRNNNPGNLRPGRYKWVGEEKADPDGYCRFSMPEWGIRAAVRNLAAYRDIHRLNTVEGIIRRWAPTNENDTKAYIASVVQRSGLGAKDILDMRDDRTVLLLLDAIIWHENGQQPYPADLLARIVAQNI